jgi:hypothetical protein
MVIHSALVSQRMRKLAGSTPYVLVRAARARPRRRAALA